MLPIHFRPAEWREHQERMPSEGGGCSGICLQGEAKTATGLCGCGSGVECCSTVKASEKRCHLGRACLLVATRAEVMPGHTEVWASQGCEAWHTFNKHDLIWYIYNTYVIPENTALTVFYAYFKLEVLKCLPPTHFCFVLLSILDRVVFASIYWLFWSSFCLPRGISEKCSLE